MKHIHLSIVAAALMPAFAWGQLAIPEKATVQQLTDGLHVIRGAGGNIALSTGPDGVVMIDDDLPGMEEKIAAAVATVTDQPVDIILNTHWHFDHAGGNKFFAGKGARIIAHENVRERMGMAFVSRLMGTPVTPSPAEAKPVITYDNRMTLHLNGQTISIEHVKRPAHTDGDSIVWFAEANVVHMGDNFFNGLYPVIDLSAGGTADGMIAAMDTVLARVDADTVIIPGHGPVTDADGLRKFRTMLDTVNKRIRLLVEEGKTADEVVALKPTINFDAEWAWEFMPPERWTRLMYDSVVESIALERSARD